MKCTENITCYIDIYTNDGLFGKDRQHIQLQLFIHQYNRFYFTRKDSLVTTMVSPKGLFLGRMKMARFILLLTTMKLLQ